MTDLEKIIDDLVYRKKNLDLDSPERRLIDRILTGLRGSYEAAKLLSKDEARRIAANIAKLPELLSKPGNK